MKKSRKHDNTSHTRFLRVETLENRFLLSVSSPNLDEIQIDGNQLSYESLLNFAEIPAYIATQPSSDASPAIRHSEIAIVPDSVAVDDISTASETENVANSLNSIVAEEQQLPIVNITKVHDGIATPDGNILQNASFELERNDSHASDRSLDVTVWFRIIYSHNWTIQQPDGTTTIIPGLVSDLVLRWCTVTFQPGETKTQITLPVAQGYFTGNVTLQVSLGNSSEND
ncbi:MAG: hypothetical protein LBJ67_03735, partial [Planctomycetaceae bacterium]|nr:hypothetical protein [Planctomycetaceae bacterium]